jgi:hypothetical protein
VRSAVAGLIALAAGVVLASMRGERATPRGPARAARWIVADRDGGEVIWLDADLFVVERSDVPWPTRVRATRAGAWVTSAVHGHPKAEHLVRWLALEPSAAASVAVPPVLDLELDVEGRALVLARDAAGAHSLLRIAAHGIDASFDAPAGSRSLAVSGSQIGLAAGSTGFLVLDEQRGAWSCAWAHASASLIDVAPGEQGWWLLCRDDPSASEWAVRIGSDLRAGEPLPVHGAERAAACGGDASALWLLGGEGSWAKRADASSGAVLSLASLPAPGVAELAADSRGGLVLAAAGAVLRLDREGVAAPGQGGFRRLADLARIQGP